MRENLYNVFKALEHKPTDFPNLELLFNIGVITDFIDQTADSDLKRKTEKLMSADSDDPEFLLKIRSLFENTGVNEIFDKMYRAKLLEYIEAVSVSCDANQVAKLNSIKESLCQN